MDRLWEARLAIDVAWSGEWLALAIELSHATGILEPVVPRPPIQRVAPRSDGRPADGVAFLSWRASRVVAAHAPLGMQADSSPGAVSARKLAADGT